MTTETDVAALLVRTQDLERQIIELSAKSDSSRTVVEFLGSSNQALVEQLRGRWTVYQALFVLLAFLLSIAFGYQVFNTAESRRALADLEEGKAELADTQQGTAALALAFSYLHNGIREFQRGDYYDSWQFAAEADHALSTVYQSISDEKLDHPILRALTAGRISALSLVARSSFLLGELDSTRAAGASIQQIDATRWEGYHFKGIGIGGRPTDDDAKLREIIEQYELSIEKRGKLNVDLFNLAELYLHRGNFDHAVQSADKYLAERPRLENAYTVLVQGYRAVAGYLREPKAGQGSLDAFVQAMHTQGGPLRGSFDPAWLRATVERLRNPAIRPETFPALNEEVCEKAALVLDELDKTLTERTK